jgi:putative copper export protein
VIAAAGLIASRFVHYAALTILFGVGTFPLYNGRSPVASEAAAFFHWSRRVQIAAAVMAFISGLFWLGFVAATMSGELSSLFDPNIVWLWCAPPISAAFGCPILG